jgi:hypothetical protein
VMVAGSAFGADAGGAVVLVAAYAVLAAGLLGVRLAVPAVAAIAGAAALAIVVGPETHATTAGSGALLGRVRLSLERLGDDWLVALVTALALALLAAYAWRAPRGPLALALLAAIAVSMVVNDSPFEVAVAGLVGYVTLARYDSSR